MHKRERKLPYGLRRRIYSFGLGIVLMIATAGILLGTFTLQSARSYRQIISQLMAVRMLKSDIGKMSETLQNYVVVGEENASDCYAAWQNLTAEINALGKSRTQTLALLVDDLQTYQRRTNMDFYKLMQRSGSEDLTDSYQQFLSQQEDRLFLCDLLMDYLNEQIAVRYPMINSESASYLALFCVTLLCLLLLTGLFSYTFANDVYQPVQKLVDQAQEMMVGHYGVEDLQVLQEDEIGYLTGAFNEMKHRIRANFQNREELWKLESMLQDAELRALQSQVNPHFLFNVLSVATEAALLERADRTVDVIENISYMLHYSLTSVRETSMLEEEMKMVKSYLFLQQKRFGDRISFEFYEPEDIPPIRIPGMTLQPIVENAVMHGVEGMKSGGRISISMVPDGQAVEFCVRDNGCGMPEDQVEALNQGEFDRKHSHSTGLGIANVRSRMEMFYRQKGLLRIESRQGEGTYAYLKYLIQKEIGDVSGSDCG